MSKASIAIYSQESLAIQPCSYIAKNFWLYSQKSLAIQSVAIQPETIGYLACGYIARPGYLARYYLRNQPMAIQPEIPGYIARNSWLYRQKFLDIQLIISGYIAKKYLAIQPRARQPEILGYINNQYTLAIQPIYSDYTSRNLWLYSHRFLATQPEILGYIAIGYIDSLAIQPLWLHSQKLDNL